MARLKELSDGTIVEMDPIEDAEFDARDQAVYERNVREAKSEALKSEALIRIQVEMPYLDDFEDVKRFRKFYAGITPSTAGINVKDIAVYALSALDTIATAPIATVEAYDPTTDPNWP